MTADTMRLFIGLELNDEARCALDGVCQALLEAGIPGKFHSPSLYHLTLCFLGNLPEDSLPALRGILDSLPVPPFSLTLSGLGSFKEGTILWAGVESCPELMDYQKRLTSALMTAGFALSEEEEYRPHITLARQVKSAVPEIPVPAVSFPVACATLFHSTRIDDKLTYLPIYRSAVL